jgi:hypothetical protein
LEAYDRGGDQELQKELERIHSEKPHFRRVKIMTDSYMLVANDAPED